MTNPHEPGFYGTGGKRTLIILGKSEGSISVEAAYVRPQEFKGFNPGGLAVAAEYHEIRINVLPSWVTECIS